ncbi:rRNA processing/ribosome biogenesis-domain-containing protein [Diplogelasinospora grovesii]|uniref:Pre-rRNA-processing protein RIX1 n=1 Tax=Diplogelasinospora grovesii TaxID=303347 RepID=A0AAN6S6K7_9PEZI|nr:rRNA processing/ribosome biogenesis-domain-containing protein [Diplogelasinospora grovesii]
MSAPPDLRVLCRRLASTPGEDLPRLCPALVNHVLRCAGPLSAAQDKSRDKSPETSMLVHKLKTHINTLLHGRSPAGRFAAICLVKAVIDVGGWECLRGADAWIQGLISVLQKPDPLASKELAIVALTRIYTLLHGYQTLVREIATPRLPSFVNACLQLIKAPESGKAPRVPASVIETITGALSKLVPLYPTTMRPLAAQIRTAFRAYIAPTSSDPILTVPQSLRESSRSLLILLHYTAPKNGNSEEWQKAIATSIKESHETADQVFRAVNEAWDSSSTALRNQNARKADGEPNGGGSEPEVLPSWTGLQAGAERLGGLLEFLASYFKTPTKAPVTIPLGEIMALTSRITLVTPPMAPGFEESVETNPAISRDEKAELWTALPDIHEKVMRLHMAMLQRLHKNALPLIPDILDQMVRVFRSSRDVVSVRETTYSLAKEVLLISGPTLVKITVESMAPMVHSCCGDLLRAAGHLEEKDPAEQKPITTNNGKQNNMNVTGDADAFLTQPQGKTTTALVRAAPTAQDLLPLLLSHIPQKHLSPETRGIIDRTAILTNNKTAMLASCLHPYKDSRGRFYPSILPFLVRQFPQDQDVEVLRTNLRAGASSANATATWDPREGLDELLQKGGVNDSDTVFHQQGTLVDLSKRTDTAAAADDDYAEDAEMQDQIDDQLAGEKTGRPIASGFMVEDKDEEEAKPNLWGTISSTKTTKESSAAKRKVSTSAEVDKPPPKRINSSRSPPPPEASEKRTVAVAKTEGGDDESDSDSDNEGSIQIDMTMDDDDEDEEEEDDEEEGDDE